MNLRVLHYQYSLGEPAGRPPEHFGYYVSSQAESYMAAPFTSVSGRALYEEAVGRYLDLEGFVRPIGTALQVAALVALSSEGEAESEFALSYLTQWGIRGRPLDDLRRMADHAIVEG